MAINRAPFNGLVDDTGNGLTGSVWNKAAIQSVLLDPIDTAFGPADVVSWTPFDSSGAGLTLTVSGAQAIKIGKLLLFTATITYPVTANGARARVSGMPSGAPSALSGAMLGYGTPRLVQIATDGGLYFMNPQTLADLTNANMSGSVMVIAGFYFASA